LASSDNNNKNRKGSKLLIFVSLLLCFSLFPWECSLLLCDFINNVLSNIVCTNSCIFCLLKKFFQGPREFTFEAVLDGLNYKEVLKKNIFLRCLWWKLNWSGTLIRFIELWTTRYIIEICNKNNFGWFWLHLTTIIKIEKVPSY